MTARTVLLSSAAVISLLLAGCAPTGVEPTPSATPTPTEEAAPPPVYLPDGGAQDNKAYFDWVLAPIATIDQRQPGKALVNSLVKAGFPKRKMQVTPDLTKTSLEADSVMVAVQINKSCLIGQRTKNKEFFSTIEPALKTGGCLVGLTRKIDW